MQAMGSGRNHLSKAWLLSTSRRGQWQMDSAFSLPLATLRQPLGCFADHSMTQTLHVLGAQRANCAGGGNRLALLSAGSSQSSAFKCQSLALLCEMSLKCPLGTPCSSLACASLFLPSPLRLGAPSPRVGIPLCLVFLGAPLFCTCSQCPLLAPPGSQKLRGGGLVIMVAAPQKGVPAWTGGGVGVCPLCSGDTHEVGGWCGGAQFRPWSGTVGC